MLLNVSVDESLMVDSISSATATYIVNPLQYVDAVTRLRPYPINHPAIPLCNDETNLFGCYKSVMVWHIGEIDFS